MRLLDIFRGIGKENRDFGELRGLYNRLLTFTEVAETLRGDLCSQVVNDVFPSSQNGQLSPLTQVSWHFCQALLAYEGHLHIPAIKPGKQLTDTEVWKLTGTIKRTLAPFEQPEKIEVIANALRTVLIDIVGSLPQLPNVSGDEWASLTVPLHTLLPNPAVVIEAVVRMPYTEELVRTGFFEELRCRIAHNIYVASGIDPANAGTVGSPFLMPIYANKPIDTLISMYLVGTPFAQFLAAPLPFTIPIRARFEHTHVVGGSGHGKTQLLQHLTLHDLDQLKEGKGSIIVIDSQGDMIRTITHLAEFSPAHPQSLADRVILIDPNDVEHPPALNLFDFGLDRLSRYSSVEQEKLINGAIALYEYLFGALLGAELTQRQGVIFRFLARLMMTVKGATIQTLMEFMDNPDATRPHLDMLDPLSCKFFETQFFSKAFDDTRRQILTRLWGVVSNSVLERMFASKHNKLGLFDAMNRGSIVLINTAKDLLKQQGCEILGRFFIALIAQAAQERAVIPEDRRKNTFLYVDEAHDYFDESMESLFNQARKYKVGLIVAHQNLDQFDSKLRATVLASTSIKVVGGMSAKDAGIFAKEMRCDPEFLQGMKKQATHSEFACFVRNHTPHPIPLTVPFGEMERRPKLTAVQYDALIEHNRRRYATTLTEPAKPKQPPTGPVFDDTDIL